jgi:hypothetical protein
MSEIVAGLIGVIAGGLVTGAVGLFQTWQARRLKSRVAARLIVGDLLRAENSLEFLGPLSGWPEKPVDFDTELAMWESQREAFAAKVSTYDWRMVSMTYPHLALLGSLCKPGQIYTKEDQRAIERAQQRVKVAARIARDHMGSRRDQRRYEERLEADRRRLRAERKGG